MKPVAPPSTDYVPGPEHPPSPGYVPDPEHPPSPVEIPYVPEPEYPEYLAPFNDEAPLEDQPLPADASPLVASPNYVADSDPKEDPGDDQADYPKILRSRVNTLFRDRPDHHRTTMLLDREAMYAREAWAGFEDRSSAIAAHVRTLKA
nr:hypothetical protein [Tanacetum cinerariifolium]